MKARVEVDEFGKVQVYIDEGSFEEGKDRIEELIRKLKASGLNITAASAVEQHRHGDGETHVHNHVIS